MNPYDAARTGSATGPSVRFQLLAHSLGVEADIRLRDAAGRWISVSEASGREVTGIGPTARAAVVASLAWLGPAAVSELLADLRLLEVSRQLRELTVG